MAFCEGVVGGTDVPLTLTVQWMQSTFAVSIRPREVLIEDIMSMSQHGLLRNPANKVSFIGLLASHLEAAGCEVRHPRRMLTD